MKNLIITIIFLSFLAPLLYADQVNDLIEKLENKSPEIRKQSAEQLGWIEDKRAVDALIKHLKDENIEVRAMCALSLGKIKDAKAVNSLIEALKDSEQDVRNAVIIALANIGEPSSLQTIIDLLDNETSTKCRVSAVKALGSFGDLSSIPILNKILQNTSEDLFVRSYAAQSIGKIYSIKSKDTLPEDNVVVSLINIVSSKNENSLLRTKCIVALGYAKSLKAEDILIKVLSDRKEVVTLRSYCAWALGMMESKKSVSALIATLQTDKFLLLLKYSLWALGNIKDESASNIVVDYMTNKDEGIRREAYQSSVKIGEACIGPLIYIVADKKNKKEIRISAIKAIEDINSKKAIPLLVKYYIEISNDPSEEEILIYIYKALKKVGGTDEDIRRELKKRNRL